MPKPNINPQNQDPTITTPGVLPTPAHKATAVALVAGALVAGGEANPNANDTNASAPQPSVALVKEATPNGFSNSFQGPDGKTYTWSDPRDKAVTISEDGKGGLEATAESGNPVSFNLHLPAHGTQDAASPEQAADPNEDINYTPPASQGFVNSGEDGFGTHFMFTDRGNGQPITIEEDGHGGLTAENQAGSPVAINIHVPTDGNKQPDLPNIVPEDQQHIIVTPEHPEK